MYIVRFASIYSWSSKLNPQAISNRRSQPALFWIVCRAVVDCKRGTPKYSRSLLQPYGSLARTVAAPPHSSSRRIEYLIAISYCNPSSQGRRISLFVTLGMIADVLPDGCSKETHQDREEAYVKPQAIRQSNKTTHLSQARRWRVQN